MKSKMPWPPAFIPVMRLDHATGLWGGMLVVKRRKEPSCASRAKLGILPSARSEDAVASSIHTRDEIGPRYRTLGWNAGRQTPEGAFLRQPGEVGHFALRQIGRCRGLQHSYP